jgi:hypothetical protein
MKKRLFVLLVAALGFVAVTFAAEITLSCMTVYAPSVEDYVGAGYSQAQAEEEYEGMMETLEAFYCPVEAQASDYEVGGVFPDDGPVNNADELVDVEE